MHYASASGGKIPERYNPSNQRNFIEIAKLPHELTNCKFVR